MKFGARNFFCFKDGIDISLELGAQCPHNISNGKNVANLLCVKGANASGKTNALKIIAFLKAFCCNSFESKPDEDIPIRSFFNNKNNIDIYCEFIFDGVQYRYELSLTDKEVVSEVLSRKKKRFTPVFERRANEIFYTVIDFDELKTIKQRKNSSIISTAHQYEHKCISPIYGFFSSITTNVNLYGKVDLSGDYRAVTKYYKENPDVFQTAINIIKDCDLGIADIEINSSSDEEGLEYYFPVFKHDVKLETDWLIYHVQSLGTQTLYKTIPFYLFALKIGGVLVMDEFDTDFHPLMLPKIVKLFDSPEYNPKNAQMIFSTHNTDILEYMGKYRTVLVNKESSECYGYRIDEIPGDIVRNDRPIVPVYNSGKIGGVPKI